MKKLNKNFQDLENKQVIEEFEQWVYAQFTDHYTPSPRKVNAFVCQFLNDMISQYDMPLSISFDEILNDWEILETFNDWFLD